MKLSNKIFSLMVGSGLIFISVCWGLYFKFENIIPKNQKLETIILLSVLSVVTLLFSISVSFFINKKIVKIEHILKNITEKTVDFENKTKNVTQSSVQLSDTVSDQASSLQQTVASVTEISSMVTQNSDFSKTSTEFSSKSELKAREGRETVAKMIEAIDNIAMTNKDMAEKITVSNKEFYQIIDVIKQIGERTKVINDIVFQTKLLSFNASVEAARAGIHGKGFAVVAEEVGKLAQMSGNSATEISEMLESSIQKVESIVNRAQESLETLMKTGKEKVDLGTEVAKQCDEALDEILEGATKVSSMMKEIANASNEQASGLGEITKAINQLDQSTLKNASISKEFSSTSKSMLTDAQEIKSSIFDLLSVLQTNHQNVQSLPVTKKKEKSMPVASIAPAKKHSSSKSATPVAATVSKIRNEVGEAPKRKAEPAHEKVIQFPSKEKSSEQKAPEEKKTFKGTSPDSVPASNDPRFVDF